jgi:hypothetical protein
MEIVEGFALPSDSKYWVFATNYEVYSQIEEHFTNENIEHHIPLLKHYNIKPFDIIFYWIKSTKKSIGTGFRCLVQVINAPYKNTKLKITKDINLQRFICKTYSFIAFNRTITKNYFENRLGEAKEYKSYLSFIQKYAKGENNFTELPKSIGRELLIYLSELSENSNLLINIENKESKENNLSENSEGGVFSKFRKTSEKKQYDLFEEIDNINSNLSDESNSDFDSDIDSHKNKSNNSSIEDSDKEEPVKEDPEHKMGYIPIVVIPCKKFKFPEVECDENDIDDYGNTQDATKKCEYFIEHIGRCRECEITNNNNVELNVLLKECIYSYGEYKEESLEIQTILEYYYETKKYNMFGDTIEKTTMKINYIKDKYAHYDKTLFICFADPPSEDSEDIEKEEIFSDYSSDSDEDSIHKYKTSSKTGTEETESERNLFD